MRAKISGTNPRGRPFSWGDRGGHHLSILSWHYAENVMSNILYLFLFLEKKMQISFKTLFYLHKKFFRPGQNARKTCFSNLWKKSLRPVKLIYCVLLKCIGNETYTIYLYNSQLEQLVNWINVCETCKLLMACFKNQYILETFKCINQLQNISMI